MPFRRLASNSQLTLLDFANVPETFVGNMTVDLAKVNQYSERLHQGITETTEMIEFQRNFPEKFRELCKVHLSFLIEIPCDFLDSETDQPIHNKTSIARFFSTKSQVVQKNEPIQEKVVQNLTQLLDFLQEDSHLSVEGLFRKSGNLARQRDLREHVLSGQSLPSPLFLRDEAPGRYTVHDVAGAVKGVLADLPEPLLTSRFLGLFAQIAGLSRPKCDDTGLEIPRMEVDNLIVRGKQLKALRILILLLPETNRLLLDRILGLLHAVSQCDNNRMSAESLGTLFGPLLLTPKKMSSKELRTLYPVVNELASFMIDWGSGLFLVPRTLAEDVTRNARRLQANRRLQTAGSSHCSSSTWRHSGDSAGNVLASTSVTSGQSKCVPTGSCSELLQHQQNDDDDSCSLVTGIAFAERSRSASLSHLPTVASTPPPTPGDNHHTQFAVAELYARIQRLPDSSQKRRLVTKFNQVNGGLTPVDSAEFVRSTSQARGIRSSLRKRLKIPPTTPLSAKLRCSEKNLRTPLTAIQDSPPPPTATLAVPGSPPRQPSFFPECKRRTHHQLCYPLCTPGGGGGVSLPSPFKRRTNLITPSSIVPPIATSSAAKSPVALSTAARLLRFRCISSPKNIRFSDNNFPSPLPNLSALFNASGTPQPESFVY